MASPLRARTDNPSALRLQASLTGPAPRARG